MDDGWKFMEHAGRLTEKLRTCWLTETIISRMLDWWDIIGLDRDMTVDETRALWE